MSYPPAPWHLHGTAFVSLCLIDLAEARRRVPAEFEVVPILPGKTLGSLYLSRYDDNSTLPYSELIVAESLVKYGDRTGSWISHIYVDHPDSVAGGREIWGFPKELATFTWGDRDVAVKQGDQVLCHSRYTQVGLPLSWTGPSHLEGQVFSMLNTDILSFRGQFEAGLKWISGSFVIPPESPFAALNPRWPWLTLELRNLHFLANASTAIGQRTTPLAPVAEATR
ncbi:MAG: acetoacetate decarboxylase family protein [Thermosynechococcaceae cyanobacterium]